MSPVPLGARLRLLLAGLSPSGSTVTPLLPDDRYQVAMSVYGFIGERLGGGEVLEVGSGTGFGCAELALRGARRVLGIERSERLTRHARRRYGAERVRFETAALEAAPPGAGSFDVAISLMAPAQSPDAESLLLGLRGSLRDSGRAVVSVPLLRSSEEIESAAAMGMSNALYPWYWAGMLGEHFDEVRSFRHAPRLGVYPDAGSRARSRLSVQDFSFVEVPRPEHLVDGKGLAAVFEASAPR